MNKCLYIIMSLLAALIHPLSAAAQSERYLELVDSAEAAIADNRLDHAEFFLNSAMELEPSSPANVMLLSNLGLIQFRNGKTDKALATLDNAHRIAPKAVVVLGNRAQILVALGRDDEAMDDYDLILRLDSLNAPALFNRGMILLSRSSVDSASVDFERLRKIRPNDRDTWIAMSSLSLAKGRFADAIEWFDRLIAKDEDPYFLLNRAYCLMMNERLSEAGQDISRGLELDPDNPDFYELRAALRRLEYRNTDADADAATAARLRSRKP